MPAGSSSDKPAISPGPRTPSIVANWILRNRVRGAFLSEFAPAGTTDSRVWWCAALSGPVIPRVLWVARASVVGRRSKQGRRPRHRRESDRWVDARDPHDQGRPAVAGQLLNHVV